MTRRPNHTGTIVQRPDGSWQASLQLNGQRVTVYGKTRADANAKLDTLQRQSFAIVVLLKLAIDRAIALRKRLQNGDQLVFVAFSAIIGAAIDNAYKAAQDELAKLTNDPEAQRAEVESIAKAL